MMCSLGGKKIPVVLGHMTFCVINLVDRSKIGTGLNLEQLI